MADTVRPGVLVTRPEPAAQETAERLRALGFEPVLAPLLHIRPRALRLPRRIDAVLATSGNAIPACPAVLHDRPLLAVGGGTAERARAAGFTQVHSADGDAAALAQLAPTLLPRGAHLLLPSGRGQGGPLAAALRAAGFRVHRRVAYAAGPVAALPEAARVALEAGRVQAVLLMSAETARAFARLLPAALGPTLHHVNAIAIAPHVADAVSHLRWRSLRVSGKPTLDHVLALL